MNTRILRALVAKDVVLFFRNRFFAFITVAVLFAWAAVYYVMPSTVTETLEVGLVAPALPTAFESLLQEEGLELQPMESEEALRQAILADDLMVGVVLADDFVPRLLAGQKGQVTLLFSSQFPEDMRNTYSLLMEEFAFRFSGQRLGVDVSQEILGPDTAGSPIPLRQRMRPLLAVFTIMIETMGLASLLSSEIEADTLRALVVTGMRIHELFTAKGITGVAMTFVQAAFLMAVMGGLGHQPVLILIALLLGSIVVTGLGFLIGSVGRDLMSVMAWGILSVLILSIPAFGVMFPGTVSNWVKVLPSYYLVEAVHQASSLGAGWGDLWSHLLILAAFGLGFLALGTIVLKRRMR